MSLSSLTRVSFVIASSCFAAVAQVVHEPVQFHPGFRAQYGLEFDATRNEVIAFGGLGHTTMWGWNGSRWRGIDPIGTGPMALGGVQTTSDPSTGRVFAYGGTTGSGPYSTQLWQWDGSTWTSLSTTGPSPRLRCAIAFDPATQSLYLHGGVDPFNSQLGDLWRFQNGAWTALSTGVARYAHTMVWDPTLASGAGGLLVYGGDLGFGGGAWTNDTWRWTGTWSQVATGGPFLIDHCMCRDSVRNRVVLVGSGYSATQCQTWEWNGIAWQQIASPNRPEARGQAKVAFDPLRGRVVLYGGGQYPYVTTKYDTWEWDGVDWSHVKDELGGPTSVATAYDEARGTQVYLTGTYASSGVTSSTWEAVGGVLQQRLVTNPPGRMEACLWYDAAVGRVMVFGGRDPNLFPGYLDDTWSFDGTAWTQVVPSVSPPGRGAAACAYDPVRQRAVVFGGLTSSGATGVLLQDTWEWDGTAWTQKAPVSRPSPRFYAALGFDPVSQRLLLFGGNVGTSATVESDETWAWNGVNWQQLAPATVPAARLGATLVTDRDRNRLMLLGGTASGSFELWEWNGGNWLARGTMPLPRQYWSGAYDTVRGRASLANADGFRVELAVPRASIGDGNANADPTIVCTSRPAVGGSLDLSATASVAGPMFAVFSFDPAMPPVAIPGPMCETSWLYLQNLPVIVAMASGTLSIPVPSGTGLEHAPLAVQMAQLRSGCLSISNALALRIQPQ